MKSEPPTNLTITQLEMLLKIYNGVTPGDIATSSPLAADLRFLSKEGLVGWDGGLLITPKGVARVMYALGD